MQFAYLKMHGAGNQIMVVDERERGRPPLPAAKLRRLGESDPKLSFDQLMWLSPAKDGSASVSYRVFNADGSEAEQCGNGIRCVAWLLARDDAAERQFVLEGPTGPVVARPVADDAIAVDMGVPIFEPKRIPFVAAVPAETYELEAAGERLTAAVLSMGNPHCVLRVDDVQTARVAELGPLLEHHPRFPARTNVGFMAIRAPDALDLRVHERGVGETLACGTGACAAVVAARRLGQVGDAVRVNLPGGQLVVKWRPNADAVWLTGTAELISEGTIDL